MFIANVNKCICVMMGVGILTCSLETEPSIRRAATGEMTQQYSSKAGCGCFLSYRGMFVAI